MSASGSAAEALNRLADELDEYAGHCTYALSGDAYRDAAGRVRGLTRSIPELQEVRASELPERAVDAAWDALAGEWPGDGIPGRPFAQQVRTGIRVTIKAAEPYIRAEERERIRALLPYHVPCCENFAASVADLVNEHEDSP